MIKITDVNFSYPGQNIKAIENINLEIKEGSFCAILGPNGSGKSTLIHLLNGIILPQTGDITIDGFSVKDGKGVWEARKRLVITFQNPDNQIVGNTVERDIAFGPENLGITREEILKRIDEVLENVKLAKYRYAEPYSLSQGQKQKLAIGSVLAMQPSYMVLDEPGSMLDFYSREEIMSILERLNQEGKTILFSTHDLDLSLKAKEIILLNKGRLIGRFPKQELPRYLDELTANDVSMPFWAKVARQLRINGIEIGPYSSSADFEEQLCLLLKS